MDNYAKINVLIVTYKQADVIGRNIESALRQKEYGLHKIIICDDCSPDNNWEVIQKYVERYSDTVIAYRNDPNLGIYGNSNRVAMELRGDADLYLWVEGDDSICDGYFKSIQDFIADNNLDIDSNFGIFSNWQSISPDGCKTINNDNKNILLKHKPYSLFLRNLASWRGSVFSKKVIEQFKYVYTDGGIGLAELLFDGQWFRYLENKYYLPVLGTSYYTQYGISTTLGFDSDWQKEDMKNKWQYLLDHQSLTRKDRKWAKYKIQKAEYMIKPSFWSFIGSLYYFFIGAYPQNIKSLSRIKAVFLPYLQRLKLKNK